MATPVLMPTFGMTEGEATILRWLKAEGEAVAIDEPLLEAETEKATLEVPSPAAGVLLRIDAADNQIVPYKATIGWVGRPGEALDITDTSAPEATGDMSSPAAPPPPASWIKASPIARRIAREHGLDLAGITGTGPRGRVVEADVRRALTAPAPPAAAAPPAAPLPAEAVEAGTLTPLSAARRLTAARTAESFRTAPHFYLQKEVRAARLAALRTELLPEFERLAGVRLSFTDLLLRALALALSRHPLLNASWTEQGVVVFAGVHLGVAVAAPQGLLVPVIRQAETLSLAALAGLRQTLAQQARAGSLPPADLTGGTFTLTNLGMYGVDSFLPVLNPPQSGILAAGAVAGRPVGVAGRVVLEPTLHLSLAVDHRVADGAQAAEFLADLVSLLEAPSRLLL